jgi:segregation and condensation protein A
METPFTVKQEAFEGPLELLLSLIEKRKLSITEISLAKVADDYISYVNSFTDFPIEQSANFILVASTLLLIKSKALLPELALSEEEQGSMEDLERRLKIYQKFKDLSKRLRQDFGKNVLLFQSNRIVYPVFAPHQNITPSNLALAIKQVISSLPKFEKLSKAIVQKVVSLEEMIQSLSKRVSNSLKMSFKDFSGFGKKEKVHVIVSFLAMLELVKQGAINVVQENHSSDITIETKEIGTPKYI